MDVAIVETIYSVTIQDSNSPDVTVVETPYSVMIQGDTYSVDVYGGLGKLPDLSGYALNGDNSDITSLSAIESITFVDPPVDAITERETRWNADAGTFDDGLPGGVVGQRYQELFFDGKNGTLSTIADGKPVMFAAPVGVSGKIEFQLAIADGSIPSQYIMGLTTQSIAPGAYGKVTWFGKVRGIDTTGATYSETWANGDLIYVGTTAGSLTNVEPNAPAQRILVAAVTTRHAVNGVLMLRPTWNSKFTDLDDVNGTALTTSGQISVWDQTNQYFDFTKNINNYQTLDGGTFGNIGINSESQVVASSVSTVTGTVISGTVSSTATINHTYYQVQEVTGVPGFDVQFTFTGLPGSPARTEFVGRYDGNTAHEVEVQVWNYVTTAWDDINATTKDLPHSITDYSVSFQYPTDSSMYISGGESKVRYYHTTSGVATHNLYVDYLNITPKTLSMPMAGTDYQITGMTAGQNNDMTVSTSSITITRAGTYLLNGSISFSGKENTTIKGKVYVNGSDSGAISFKRKLGSSGDVGSASGNNILNLSLNDVLTFYFSSDTDNSFLSVDSLDISILKINRD